MTPTRTVTTGEPIRLADEATDVVVQKIFTRMGERLEIRSGDRSTRLDAIMLESVAWQDSEELASKAADELPAAGSAVAESDAVQEDRDPITVSSEFALAELEHIDTPEGPRLRIEAPKLGYDIEVGPRELAWLTTRTHETFTEWLETPFGPGGDDHDHGH
jgi:hypothetical protein